MQPPQSVDGDVLLQLDDDCTLTAHATLLQLASTVLAGVLACSSQQASAGMPHRSAFHRVQLRAAADLTRLMQLAKLMRAWHCP